jgi:hypothetical protein
LLSFRSRPGFRRPRFRLPVGGSSSLATAWLLSPAAGRSRALPVPSAPGAERRSAPGTGKERKGGHTGIRWCRRVAGVVAGLAGRRSWPRGGQRAVIYLLELLRSRLAFQTKIAAHPGPPAFPSRVVEGAHVGADDEPGDVDGALTRRRLSAPRSPWRVSRGSVPSAPGFRVFRHTTTGTAR